MSEILCKIYIDHNYQNDEFRDKLLTFLKVKEVIRSSIQTLSYDVSLIRNDEFDVTLQKEFPDGFLYFKNILEIYFTNKEISYCVFHINILLSWLWEQNSSAVAVCDFEHMLINNGGYCASHLPWPK